MRITAVIAAVAVVFVFFLSFSVVSAAAAEDDEGPGVIVIGYQPSTHQVAAMVAAEKGWWLQGLRRFGVEDVKLNEFATGPPEMDAMLIGLMHKTVKFKSGEFSEECRESGGDGK